MALTRSISIINESEANAFFIIDPPCNEYGLAPNEKIVISIKKRDESDNENDFVFRYGGNGFVNINIGIDDEIFIQLNDHDIEKIW